MRFYGRVLCVPCQSAEEAAKHEGEPTFKDAAFSCAAYDTSVRLFAQRMYGPSQGSYLKSFRLLGLALPGSAIYLQQTIVGLLKKEWRLQFRQHGSAANLADWRNLFLNNPTKWLEIGRRRAQKLGCFGYAHLCVSDPACFRRTLD